MVIRLSSDQEDRIKKALENYYSTFGKNGITLQYACTKAGANIYEAISYISEHARAGYEIGMPDNEEYARKFLQTLKNKL